MYGKKRRKEGCVEFCGRDAWRALMPVLALQCFVVMWAWLTPRPRRSVNK